ncbi:unnamed protein product [Miscanthus lutarioriparius]|uniref:Uncharacterized protein n=1 Tax=Miscanthus lutarioriparius TaxID=422564 RepID=A0A811R7M9_9POAL|nr:unnamed protein product [Miscanthus lutarioriparius]
MDDSVTDTLLEQVRACAWISIACMNTDPAKRPNTEVIMDILAQTEIRDKVEKSSSAMPVAKTLSVEEEKAGKVPQGLKARKSRKMLDTSSFLNSNTSIVKM